MAVGEYISLKTQRDAVLLELEKEKSHITKYPSKEWEHLEEILLTKYMIEQATVLKLKSELESAFTMIKFHIRIELGYDTEQPDESPIKAAFASFISFMLGGTISMLPWYICSGVLQFRIFYALFITVIVSCSAIVLFPLLFAIFVLLEHLF